MLVHRSDELTKERQREQRCYHRMKRAGRRELLWKRYSRRPMVASTARHHPLQILDELSFKREATPWRCTSRSSISELPWRLLSSVHCEADGSCGLLQAWRCSLPGGWRSGWRFGVSGDGGGAGAGLDPIAFFSAAWGALCKCRGPVCISFSLLDLFVMPLFYV